MQLRGPSQESFKMYLSDSFLMGQPEPVECNLSIETKILPDHDSLLTTKLPSMVGKEYLATVQKSDPTLVNCIRSAVDHRNLLRAREGYFWDDEMMGH